MKTCFFVILLVLSSGCANMNTILVLDAEGNPVPQAEVTYFEFAKIVKPRSGTGTTDYSGIFRVRGADMALITARKGDLWGNGKLYPPRGIVVLDPNSRGIPFGSYKTPDELSVMAYELYNKRLNDTSISNQPIEAIVKTPVE
jgi:hypothetical protein